MTDDRQGASRISDALSSRTLQDKREYVRGLALRDDEQALASLTECLCDESAYLRDLAEAEFPRLGERGAKAVLPLIDSGLWFTRASAARILGRMGHGAAVPGLLRLCGDSNALVAEAARDALIAVGRQSGGVRIAHALHRLTPDIRIARLETIGAADRGLRDRLQRLMRSEDLMGAADVNALTDDSPAVRASEEGVEWEILTGPPPAKKDAEARGRERG
jgi:HEAT repeat protein